MEIKREIKTPTGSASGFLRRVSRALRRIFSRRSPIGYCHRCRKEIYEPFSEHGESCRQSELAIRKTLR